MSWSVQGGIPASDLVTPRIDSSKSCGCKWEVVFFSFFVFFLDKGLIKIN